MMRSNPACVICASPIRPKIDEVLESFWDEDELFEKIREVVLAEMKKNKDDTEKLERILQIGRKALRRHEMEHRRYGPRQQFKQPVLANGDVLEQIDFSQLMPHTSIAEGVKRLIFKRCRLENCDIPKDAKLIECHPTHISYCAHINPGLPLTCPKKCQHVVKETPEIVVDGRVILKNVYKYLNLPMN
jgi:hypothetical protein